MERDGQGQHVGSAASSPMDGKQSLRRPSASAARTALVLYGSETGNAQDVAEEVGRVTERLLFHTTVLDLNSVQLRDIVRPTVVVFVISTTGQGEMPQNARTFWKTLLSGALRPGMLKKVSFSSFGLGDSSYPRYNIAHRMLHGRLIQLGAREFCDRWEGNEQHPEGHSAGFREWIVSIKRALNEVFPLPNGTPSVAEEVFMEPKWKLAVKHNDPASKANDQISIDDRRERISTDPSLDLLPLKNGYQATIESNDRITPSSHFQDVRLLDLRLNESVTYRPGAVAVIHPKNFAEDVETFIGLMQWGDVADRPIELIASTLAESRAFTTPSPLRYLDLNRTRMTLRWLLENVLDIMSIPRRSFFAELSFFAGKSTEDEAYQKERLLELANPELIDELWDYTTRPKRTILEVMMDFTTIKIPWQYALSILPLMKGRQFSITSGGALAEDDAGRTRIQLLIAIADPPSPIIKWRRRYGVCTRYIAALRSQQGIAIGVQAGYLDVQPDELMVPLIMVGPGTGLAPMRSMIYQRLAWASERDRPESELALKGDILFFGCRSEHADDFFRNEWTHLVRDQGLTVHTAFSRDNDKPKQYVQDQIHRNGADVYDALVHRNGKVYVCGSSGNMPKSVRQALLDALTQYDGTMSSEDAEAYLDQMEKDGRYKQETW